MAFPTADERERDLRDVVMDAYQRPQFRDAIIIQRVVTHWAYGMLMGVVHVKDSGRTAVELFIHEFNRPYRRFVEQERDPALWEGYTMRMHSFTRSGQDAGRAVEGTTYDYDLIVAEGPLLAWGIQTTPED